ncbi:hypothetical protein OC834_005338 [Tilletia horrida]|uniref:Uncharacterized protein n=1 Tax=Tilletia horrida TaxID=155126 RepID=A0AAN6JQD2_9BASI|nr:hypothetical protein OC834_005338 [Tilletia horrida]KAK0529062.1 hypothetical protein OC842_004358 [Tilletia horrida]
MASPSAHSFPFATPDALEALRDAYERDGFVIVDGIFTSAEELDALRTAAADVVQLTRKGGWPHRRVVGKQFPPFDEVTQDYWGVQHLMSPALPHSRLFTSFYASRVLDVSSALLGVPLSQMQLELFNLLINPTQHAFALGWHRDDIKPSISTEEERRVLVADQARAGAAKDGGGIQWNAALYDDACLFVVPGTHRRVRTEQERKANATPPPPPTPIPQGKELSTQEKEALDGAWELDPPTTQRVVLKAGQSAFYSQRILHRASYLPNQIRATLHGCYGESGNETPSSSSTSSSDTAPKDAHPTDTSVGEQRARNVLQHGVEWMKDPQFGAALPERLRPMWDNLLRMERQWAGKNLGYSLDN